MGWYPFIFSENICRSNLRCESWMSSLSHRRADIRRRPEQILYTYVMPGAESEIVLPPQMFQTLISEIEDKKVDGPEVFREAAVYVYPIMEKDVSAGFVKFKKSRYKLFRITKTWRAFVHSLSCSPCCRSLLNSRNLAFRKSQYLCLVVCGIMQLQSWYTLRSCRSMSLYMLHLIVAW